MDVPELAASAAAGVLLVGFAAAAVADWRRREVSDSLWIVLGVAGLGLGFLAGGGSTLSWVSWAIVGAFVLEHVVPWDAALGRREPWAGWLEVGIYLGVTAALLGLGYRYGVGGPGGVPIAAAEVFVSVLFARGLFEARILYGGADAKALMVAALLVPIYPDPWLPIGANARAALGIFPFSLTLLLNAAVLGIAVPITLLARNLVRGDRAWPQSFTSYRLDVRLLPERFVWLRDPTFSNDAEEAEVESSEDDRKLRERQRDRLLAAGVERTWVTPQIPFVVLMAGGAFVGLLAGSLAFDLFSLL